ncbi:UNVERIFIED_CONTAM: hypothetical protein Slati_1161700 [Sesamum latifolium]|uniref:Uncharacterized protein n=1 Tax=Sesamum latifolium TaxID=2727402 RepID=A0AAW2XDM5_9LAMI
MSKKAYPEVTFHETVEKYLLHLGGISEDDGDLKDDSSSSTPRSISIVAPVMVTNTTTLQEQIANLTRVIEGLAKHVQENLSLNCKDRLSEASAIEIYIQGMHWGLCYILQGIKPKTFEELATRAHAIEITLDLDKRKYLSAGIDEDGHEKDEEYVASY